MYFTTYCNVFRYSNQLLVPLGFNVAHNKEALSLLLKNSYEIHKAVIHGQAPCKWRQKRRRNLFVEAIYHWLGNFPPSSPLIILLRLWVFLCDQVAGYTVSL